MSPWRIAVSLPAILSTDACECPLQALQMQTNPFLKQGYFYAVRVSAKLAHTFSLSKCLFQTSASSSGARTEHTCFIGLLGRLNTRVFFKEVDKKWTLCVLQPLVFLPLLVKRYFCLVLEGEQSEIAPSHSPHSLSEGHLSLV